MSQSVATDATLRHTMIALIVVAVAASYLGSLNGPFVFEYVTANHTKTTVRHPGEVGRLLCAPGGQKQERFAGRPLLNLTLALNFCTRGNAGVGVPPAQRTYPSFRGVGAFWDRSTDGREVAGYY